MTLPCEQESDLCIQLRGGIASAAALCTWQVSCRVLPRTALCDDILLTVPKICAIDNVSARGAARASG